jgi:hypothetical protein
MAQADGKSGGGGGMSQAEVKYLADKVSYLDKSMEEMKKLGDAVESRMGGAISSQGFGRTLKKFQAAVSKTEARLVRAWGQFYLFIIVLLLLFILHQVRRPLALLPYFLRSLTRLRVANLRSYSFGSTRIPTPPLSARRCSSSTPRSGGT